ncbi:VOC family protein [Amycolatopsis sp. NPDC054798]
MAVTIDLPEDDSAEDGAWLCHPDGAGPRLHIDIRLPKDDDPAKRWERINAEAERLVAAGGTILVESGEHHVVMADPAGNEFCVAA